MRDKHGNRSPGKGWSRAGETGRKSLHLFTVLLLVLLPAVSVIGKKSTDPFRFAAEMAEKGNWREALFRWRQAEKQDPDNPRVLNNLAVALEVRGEAEAAGEMYSRLAKHTTELPETAYNIKAYNRFWKADIPIHLAKKKLPRRPAGSRKRIVVDVPLPVPAQLDVSKMSNILVVSFLIRDTDLLDTNRELVHFLRSEFRRKSPLKSLDVTPIPPIPEQTLEELAANRKFWQHVGNEYGADLIVSGRVFFDRRDASGYQDVDRISESTGHKVRQSMYVEQEEFTFDIDLLFMSGTTGELLFRNSVKRKSRFQGLANDPITGFHQLAETITGDVLSIVSKRRRFEPRMIYRDRKP